MKARVTVQVQNRSEATAIQTALEDPTIRAFAIVFGVLATLPGRAQRRVLEYVTDKIAEQAQDSQGGSADGR